MSPKNPRMREPHTPLHMASWQPVLLPSAMEMTPPDSHAREKDRDALRAAPSFRNIQLPGPSPGSYATHGLVGPNTGASLGASPRFTRAASVPNNSYYGVGSANPPTPGSVMRAWQGVAPNGQRWSSQMGPVPHLGPPSHLAPPPPRPTFDRHLQQPPAGQGSTNAGPVPHLEAPTMYSAPEGDGSPVDSKLTSVSLQSGAITNYKEYEAYLQRQKRIPTTKAMVWSQDVEEAFMEGLRLIPRVGRRKITVGGRLRGRNELIADFIFKKTRQRRSRKQVSSHIQVLKHILKDDEKFMQLVADLPESKDGVYESITAETFDEFIEKLQDPELDIGDDIKAESSDGVSPHSGSTSSNSPSDSQSSTVPTTVASSAAVKVEPKQEIQQPVPTEMPGLLSTPRRGSAAASNAAHITSGNTTIGSTSSTSSVDSTGARRSVPHVESQQFVAGAHASYDGQQPPQGAAPDWFVSQLSTPPQRRGHHRTTSASVDLGSERVIPVSFRLSKENPEAQQQHVFTRLMRPQLESPVKPQAFERITQRFPHIAKMREQGEITDQTPIIHGSVKLDISPDASNQAILNAGSFSADVQFLVWGTTPSQLMASPGRPRSNGTPAYQRVPDHMWQCITTVASMGRTLLNIRDIVTVREELLHGMERLFLPYTTDFWAHFLAGFNQPTAETGAKKNPDAAIGAITVTQTVYCCPNNGMPTIAFIVVYEFERAHDAFSARTVFRRVKMRTKEEYSGNVSSFLSSPRAISNHTRIPSFPESLGSPARWRAHAPALRGESNPPSHENMPPPTESAPANTLLPEEPLGEHLFDSPVAPIPTVQPQLSEVATGNFDAPPIQRSMSTVNAPAPSLTLPTSPLRDIHEAPMSATEPSDFAAFSLLEGERIQRSMTAFELPVTWQDPDMTEWYMFD